MTETFIPVVQVECNQVPSRHEQGIPHFINHAPQHMINPGVQHLATSYPAAVIGQHTELPVQQMHTFTMPPPPPAAPVPLVHQPPSFQGFDHGVIKSTMSQSPSISSSLSSIYEDCVSIPPTSPHQQAPEGILYQQHLSNHSFVDPSGDQPNHRPLKSTSLSSIPSDVGSSSSNIGSGRNWNSTSNPSSQPASTIKPEQAMAMVNVKLRDRISTLEKKNHNAIAEATFLGDRNWRLEAHVDSLMHTLEVLGVTDVEDLTGKTLPLPMFRVKVKAGYRLGPFNRLPRRAAWSYDEDLKQPPNIDFSSDRARTIKTEEAKPFNDGDDLHLPAGTDIGLSVRQMFHYERQIEELRQENHALTSRVAELTGRENGYQENVHTMEHQNAEMYGECQDYEAEPNSVVLRLQKYDDSCGRPMMQQPSDEIGDHYPESTSFPSSTSFASYPDNDYHQPGESSRAGPYCRRARGGVGIRDGRRYRRGR